MIDIFSAVNAYLESLPGWALVIFLLSLSSCIAILVLAPRSMSSSPGDYSAAQTNSGLIQIRALVSNQDLESFLASATKRIRILVPWFVDPLCLIEMLAHKARDENFILHVILLEPSSPYLKKRGEVVQSRHLDYGPQECVRTLMALSQAFRACKSHNVRVFVYDSLPSVFIAERDDSALIGFHLNTGTALRNPHLEVALIRDNSETVFGKMVREELSKVISIATELDLNSLIQRSSSSVTYRPMGAE